MDRLAGLVRHDGNAALWRAVEMSALSTCAGIPFHLHAQGVRGTGKTTILRAARRLLPPIQRIRGCPYNCDPQRPHCPAHGGLSPAAVADLGAEWIPMPFLEISHSARIGTVVGSIDLARLVDGSQPAAALLPGTLPRAHRGIVLVDEINRLAETAPELADVLLDAMGTRPGRVQVEETGLPTVSLPLLVTVWAASNPDEDPGPLEEVRRQLSDRFDVVVVTARPPDAGAVGRILAAFDQELAGLAPTTTPDPAAPPVAATDASAASAPGAPSAASAPGAPSATDPGADWADRCRRLRAVSMPGWLHQTVADMYTQFGIESLRAVQALALGARLAACTAGRAAVGWPDLGAVAPLVLQHRLSGPALARVIQYIESGAGGRSASVPGSDVAGAAPGPEPRADMWRWERRWEAQWPLRPEAVRPGTVAAPPSLWHRLQVALGFAQPATPAAPGSTGATVTAAAAAGDGTPPAQPGLDPTRQHLTAPPHAARPLRDLDASQWVYSEADLQTGTGLRSGRQP